ncbi:hypothetical protein HS7_11530 [Sulfolobales archaeon HS-7]|nr:hypothetical protein HS7_11530 [Sulfolobales archaeon HS-7]
MYFFASSVLKLIASLGSFLEMALIIKLLISMSCSLAFLIGFSMLRLIYYHVLSVIKECAVSLKRARVDLN